MARHTAHISPAAGRPYDRAELLSDAVIHLTGLGLAVFSVPVLITLAAVWRGDAAGIVGVSIYGVTLIVMLSASLAYNHVYREDLSDTLRKLDMSAIYLKIAGTVTPFALLSGTGATFLAAMWTVAVLATATVFLRKRRSSGLSVAIGLGMGWAVLFGGGDVIASTSSPVFGLMIAGGVLYSLGTPFLLLHRLRFHNAIWHAFVVLASGVFFVAITWHLISTAMI